MAVFCKGCFFVFVFLLNLRGWDCSMSMQPPPQSVVAGNEKLCLSEPSLSLVWNNSFFFRIGPCITEFGVACHHQSRRRFHQVSHFYVKLICDILPSHLTVPFSFVLTATEPLIRQQHVHLYIAQNTF